MMATILGLFDVVDFTLAGRMTLEEFRLRRRGHKMKLLEREKELHLQAYLNRVVKATKNNGKEYVFKKFVDFYDEEKQRHEVLNGSFAPAVNEQLIEIAKRMQRYEKGGY